MDFCDPAQHYLSRKLYEKHLDCSMCIMDRKVLLLDDLLGMLPSVLTSTQGEGGICNGGKKK